MMFRNSLTSFLTKKSRPIAMDIGTDSIKLLQMQRMGNVVSVRACARWRFPQDALSDPPQRRRLAVQAVRDMLKNGSFRGRRVVTALPSSSLNIKNVRLPRMSDEELREAVTFEAKERFGFEVTADKLSYLNAGEVRQGAETRDEIIMLAAPPDALDEHLDMLDEMGLNPQHIDAEPIALFRSFERFLRRREDEPAVSVLVEVGRGGTRVVVARGRQIVFVKSIDIGGQSFTQALAKHLNLSYRDAAELRIRTMPQDGAPEPGQSAAALNLTVRDAMRPQVEDLAREVGLCLRYCSVTFRGLRPNCVTLTGGEAYDPALQSLLSEQLNAKCVLGQPLRGIDVANLDVADRRGTLSEWAVCAGLAIRDMEIKAVAERDTDAQCLPMAS